MHGTYYNATIAAYVTLYLRLGKDEVGSSNLPSSSKKHRKLQFSVLFCCKNAENGVGQNVGQPPDPHPDPHADRFKEYRRGGFASSLVFYVCNYATIGVSLLLRFSKSSLCSCPSVFCL